MEKLRKKAIKRYLKGEPPKEIYQSLGKGKTWFFKQLRWLSFIKKLYVIAKDRLSIID